MPDKELIPCEFFKESWEDADHPMACVSETNRFVRVNHAFEKLLGYSTSELEGRTWMEFTSQRFVGGDLASVDDVLDGNIESYQLEKDYIHKRGHAVPVVLTVRKYPRASSEPLLYFRVESPPAVATRPELDELNAELRTEIVGLKLKMEELKNHALRVTVGDNIGGDKVGRDKNNDMTIKIMVAGLFIVASTVAWLVYYVASVSTGNKPAPPNVVMPNESN